LEKKGFIKKFVKGGKIMKKTPLFIFILAFLLFSQAGVSYGWQGRMAGMGDPYGLVEDESDFLIHPSGIAKGEGINFYGNYRFNYRDVMDWNYTWDWFNRATGALIAHWPYRGSGDEQEHDSLLGAAFPLGPGRMGLFLQYAGKRGDYDGRLNELYLGAPFFHKFDLESDLDTFSLRLLYGLPMGGFKLGSEIQLAYRKEENETFTNYDFGGGLSGFYTNYPFGSYIGSLNLFPFMFPYDSKYWEALLKGSLEGAIGPAKIAFTLKGGFIFGADNKLKYSETTPFSSGGSDMDGEVKGWRIGGDLFLRYPLAKDLILPFLLKIEYQKKTRDGDGLGFGTYAGQTFDYKNRERILQSEMGGGIDKEFIKGTRIAAGIYYAYLQNKNDFWVKNIVPGEGVRTDIYDHKNYPDSTEHQVILRLSGEKEFSSSFVMRMGLNFFYGWVKEDLRFNFTSPIFTSYIDKISLDGSHWGIGGSLGGTLKFQRFSLEPFLGGGYQKWDLDGDGTTTWATPAPGYYEMEKIRGEWLIGGGFSIKF
jgi:hypothetical protein